MTSGWRALGLAAMVLASPLAARAAADITVIDCQVHDAEREAADVSVAEKALTAIQAFNRGEGDLTTLQAMLPDIDAALSHAPDKPSAPERCGDSIVLYSADTMRFLVLSAMISENKDLGVTKVEQREPLPYGLLGFAAGWIHLESGDLSGAHTAYAKGRLNDPDDPVLVSEDSYALSEAGRDEDALALLDGFLAGHSGLDDGRKALLERKRGYALINLKRFDEAEIAYRRSLELEPGNATAQEELDYIAKQRSKT